MEFTIPGEPVGKGRPRRGKGHFYTPERTEAYEQLVRHIYRAKGGDHFSSLPVRVEINAYYEIPASASRVRRRKMDNGELLPTKKPDFDNVAKIICDALNGIAYNDDSQVVEAIVKKRYSTQPRVDVLVEAVEREDSEDVSVSQ